MEYKLSLWYHGYLALLQEIHMNLILAVGVTFVAMGIFSNPIILIV